MTFAIYSKFNTQTQVHYSHLTEDQAENEVDRLNSSCAQNGLPAIYWCEEHHPDCVFVLS